MIGLGDAGLLYEGRRVTSRPTAWCSAARRRAAYLWTPSARRAATPAWSRQRRLGSSTWTPRTAPTSTASRSAARTSWPAAMDHARRRVAALRLGSGHARGGEPSAGDRDAGAAARREPADDRARPRQRPRARRPERLALPCGDPRGGRRGADHRPRLDERHVRRQPAHHRARRWTPAATSASARSAWSSTTPASWPATSAAAAPGRPRRRANASRTSRSCARRRSACARAASWRSSASSGAGKTTLMKILAGVDGPTAGAVTVNGEDVSLHRTSIGYVPQQEITHGRLTVREALRYSARLRLPDDATAAELGEACARVLGELGARRARRHPRGAPVGRAAPPRRRRRWSCSAARACSSSTSRPPAWTPASRRG